MARKNNIASKEQEIALLKARLASLENGEKEAVEETPTKKIQLDDYIKVMSLLPYPLNLSTREGGQGTVKRFQAFGEIKQILYKDLMDMMDNHPNFVNAGYFYIMNPDVVRQHGLDEVYSKILTKEKMEEIISTSSDNCINLYSSANEKQQEVIIQILVEKVRDNSQSVNLNTVDRISRLSKVDIIKKAEDERELLNQKEQ